MTDPYVQPEQAAPACEPLELPHGIRFPRDDEYRWGQDDERSRVAQARLSTGYVLRETASDSFSAYFTVNVHARNIWACFCDLVHALLPEVAAPIIQFNDDEPRYGTYAARADVIDVFRPHAAFLQQECYLAFGMMFQYQGRTEEVLVHHAKYLQVWTNQPALACKVFSKHRLIEVPGLRFIDAYPRVTEALLDDVGNSIYPGVLEAIEAAFDQLDPVHPPTIER